MSTNINITECAKEVTKSILDICSPFASSEQEITQLTLNVSALSEQECQDFFLNKIPSSFPPSQLTPRTAMSVSKIVFAKIMNYVLRGGNHLRCQELMQPNNSKLSEPQEIKDDLFSKIVDYFSFPYLLPLSFLNRESSQLDQLCKNTIVTCLVGGAVCYLFGPSKVAEFSLKTIQWIGLRGNRNLPSTSFIGLAKITSQILRF